MKFLIDAHLPPGLRAVFQAAGHVSLCKALCSPHCLTMGIGGRVPPLLKHDA